MNSFLDYVVGFMAVMFWLAVLGWGISKFEQAKPYVSWIFPKVSKMAKFILNPVHIENSSNFLVNSIARVIQYSIGGLFIFYCAKIFAWVESILVSGPTELASPDKLFILSLAILISTICAYFSALLKSSVVYKWAYASINLGATMLVWDQPLSIVIPASMSAIGAVGIALTAESIETDPVHEKVTSDGSSSHPMENSIRNFAKPARHTFKSVAGMSELKAELLKAGNAVILSMRKHEAKNGILFHGDPGNGKTFFAEALAGELGLKFLPVTFGDMASKWVGETTSNAMKVFDDAVAQAPCMLFMDEIDSVFIDRSKVVNADSEAPKTLNAILTRLVDIRSKGVLVVAATNFIDKLDSASIREGRFDFKIEIPCPDYEARQSLLMYTLKSGLTIDREVLESVSRRWEGFSVSRIRAIGDKTREMLAEKGIKQVEFDHLMEALRKIQGSKGDRIPEDVLPIDKLSLSPEMRTRFNRIAARMNNIDQVESFGGTAPTGILFSGPPGTGKTLGVMSLAKSSGWAFIKTTGNELLESPDKMDKIKARALDIRPCIIFIDEADDVLADRSMSAAKSVTNRLLAIMDGAGGKLKDVVFIAATNHPDLLDEAMLRGGRFTEKIEFSLPTDDVISTYVAEWISKTKAPLADDFNVQNVTNLLSGQSLANAKEILQGAINESIERISGNRNEKVRLADLISAFNLISSD